MNDYEVKKQYFNILIKKGVNLQKGQTLHITAPLELAEYVELIMIVAYENDARYVDVKYINSNENLIRSKFGNEKYFDYFSFNHADSLISLANNNTAFLKINNSINYSNKLIDNTVLKRFTDSNIEMLKNFSNISKSDKISSCSTVLPTIEWAKDVFPNLSEDDAFDTLWKNILYIGKCVDSDPISKWDEHISNIIVRRDKLNLAQYDYLKFNNSKTNITVDLPRNHNWVGGCQETTDGIKYMPNFPTEEIFTANFKYGINGTVHNSKPLIYQGNLINDFTITFKEGKIIDAKANIGQEFLDQLITFDDGCKYCGEIALLPGETQISKTNIIYKNTLLDENAACHMAIGCAYTCSINGLNNKDYDSFENAGINYSKNHFDFMFGTKDTTVVAIKNDREYVLIENGNWKI